MSINNYQYKGNGESGKKLPEYNALFNKSDPADYIADPALCEAVNVALALGQPLVLTGEPGTGKTQLAASIAHEYGLPLLEFHTKTTSLAGDMLYQYDAIRRFQDSQLPGKNVDIKHYITYQPLGIAILLTKPASQVDKILPEEYQGFGPTRSVILIDEIDKAPRDLPNDVLMEIERMQFKVIETGEIHKADKKYHPIVILTSNSERNLPDAFLRRCVFYHISFPGDTELKNIVKKRFANMEISPDFSDEFIKAAITHFTKIRKLGLRKKPATAEFLAWITILKSLDIDITKLTKEVEKSYTVLAKSHDDLKRLKKFLKDNVGDEEEIIEL